MTQNPTSQNHSQTDALAKFRQHDKDTGSIEHQIISLHFNIKDLAEHVKTHKKDIPVKRMIMKLVAKLNKCRNYLKLNNFRKYVDIAQHLGMRK